MHVQKQRQASNRNLQKQSALFRKNGLSAPQSAKGLKRVHRLGDYRGLRALGKHYPPPGTQGHIGYLIALQQHYRVCFAGGGKIGHHRAQAVGTAEGRDTPGAEGRDTPGAEGIGHSAEGCRQGAEGSREIAGAAGAEGSQSDGAAVERLLPNPLAKREERVLEPN